MSLFSRSRSTSTSGTDSGKSIKDPVRDETPRPGLIRRTSSIYLEERFRVLHNLAEKCPICDNSVHKAEEVLALGSRWHNSCFCCGGIGSKGCKKKLSVTQFESYAGVPYCFTCFRMVGDADRTPMSPPEDLPKYVPTSLMAVVGHDNAFGRELQRRASKIAQPHVADESSEEVHVSVDSTSGKGDASIEASRKAAYSTTEEEEEEEKKNEVDDAVNYSAMVDSMLPKHDFSVVDSQYRWVVLQFRYHFDENGTLCWMGTAGKTRPYVNPHNGGQVVAAMSSVYKGNADAIANNLPSPGAVYSDNVDKSWARVDLGENVYLMPDYYTIRHGASSRGNALRNWKLQAKVREGDPWVALKHHVDDTSLNEEPFSAASWPVYIPKEIRDRIYGFRIFRIIQVGPNSGGNNCLFCAGLEFYGTLFVRK